MTTVKYRKKQPDTPVIDAIQLTKESADVIMHWCLSACTPANPFGVDLIIHTPEGDMRAETDDWVTKGGNGEFRVVRPSAFQAAYERVT